VSAARHLCSTAGQACGPARGIRSPGDLRRRRHLVDDPSGGGSGTCASWPQLRIVVVMATSQARASCRGGRYPPDRTIPSLRPTAGSFSKIVCVRLWPHLVGGSGLGALGDDCSRVCDRLQARSWPGGCGCAFWHVARACRSSHDTEPTESASPQMVPAAAPVAPCSVAMATCVTCRVTLGGVAMLRCFTLAESPARACLPERRACNAKGPDAHHLCAGLAHCQLLRCPGRPEPLALAVVLHNGMEVGSQAQICAGVGSSGSGSLRLLTRSIPTAYVPSHCVMQRRLPACIVACER
jgi:hypothetical protein